MAAALTPRPFAAEPLPLGNAVAAVCKGVVAARPKGKGPDVIGALNIFARNRPPIIRKVSYRFSARLIFTGLTFCWTDRGAQ